MSANASNLLTLNPIIVYAMLGLYGLLFAFVFLYLHTRFKTSSRVLSLLTNDWADAESKHANLVETAHGRIARLSVDGNAIPQACDLESRALRVKLPSSGPLVLTIDHARP